MADSLHLPTLCPDGSRAHNASEAAQGRPARQIFGDLWNGLEWIGPQFLRCQMPSKYISKSWAPKKSTTLSQQGNIASGLGSPSFQDKLVGVGVGKPDMGLSQVWTPVVYHHHHHHFRYENCPFRFKIDS